MSTVICALRHPKHDAIYTLAEALGEWYMHDAAFLMVPIDSG
ncbi:hypothetical protein [Caballeronia sp. HLA56]